MVRINQPSSLPMCRYSLVCLLLTRAAIFKGWARISNVEFFRTGQEGWTERWDPRFSLAWVNTGPHVDKRPSYVNCSAFHDGYSTAIGLFGASDIAVLDNVVHRTIHDGKLHPGETLNKLC